MKCWYKQNNPVLMLKPQKVERIWANPEIFHFHDILTDEQVELIKEHATPIVSIIICQFNLLNCLMNEIVQSECQFVFARIHSYFHRVAQNKQYYIDYIVQLSCLFKKGRKVM